MSLNVIEGTWDEIERRKTELIGHYLRVTIQPEKWSLENSSSQNFAPTRPDTAQRTSSLGKYAFVSGGSERFAEEKQTELELEDRVHP